ncbi:hypothetical protein K461DRAFT_276215 [Myriangium duriaei CBS 260.36]|uniref:Uncharacterized protein n=1 Tax=Myriangium duriaei CBS 260.36 TaxID=1168546 RepID=A0A9P4JA13_9PEZI|nr:hypothetical protein K461DRAFT_276215 [Myriangium duriaei CBS 260.36]
MTLLRHYSTSPVQVEQRSTCSTSSDKGSRRSSGSDRSDKSYRSQSTVPTEYEYLSSKPALFDFEDRDNASYAPAADARASVQTYDSSASFAHESPEDDSRSDSSFEPPHFYQDDYYDDTIPTTPADFSKLFPSTRKLCISHDDSTPDGNMNLKVNTEVRTPKGRIQNMTLFHLRMYDLKAREMSLRRYDRNSGREVCHSTREYFKPSVPARPGLQKTISSAFANLRTRSDSRMNTLATTSPDPRHSFESDELGARPNPDGPDSGARVRVPDEITRLEFSNYAKVEVKRRGAKASRRYDFEYWGTTYSWKRITVHDGEDEQTSYHLVRAGGSDVLAKITPKPLSPAERTHERRRGGWVPPCHMWINDERLIRGQKDVSDVVVASGLATLVDDCIKRQFRDASPKNAMSILKWQTGRPNSKHSIEDATSIAFRPSSQGHASPRGPTRLRSASYN